MSDMFAGYNKSNDTKVRTGNWVEEEALKKLTGFARVPEKNPKDRKAPVSTAERVIIHSDAEHPKDYRATSHFDAPHEIPEFVVPPGTGPRERLRLQKLYEQAKAIESRTPEVEENPDSQRFQSASREAYQSFGSDYLASLPKPVPRGRNGGKRVDPEIQSLTKSELEERDRKQLKSFRSKGKHYSDGAAVSIYSHAVKTGNNLNYPLTSVDSVNPFAKSTAFSNDIRDPSRRHAEASNPGVSGCELERLGPSVHQLSAINAIRKQLADHNYTREHLFDVLETVAESGNGRLTKKSLSDGLQQLGIGLSQSQMTQAFSFFYRDNSEEIDLVEFVESLTNE